MHMLLLTIRTDRPEAELGLFQSGQQLAYSNWPAHRQLAETIHLEIAKVLEGQRKTLRQIEGLVVFKGPGSFTGLRIGLSVANALAYSLQIPIVAREHDDWIQAGTIALRAGENEIVSLPEYGALPHITLPKH